MMVKSISVLILISYFLNCSDRDALNPLDPDNPITMGRPTGVNLVPLRKSVQVVWDPIDVSDILYYLVFRAQPGRSDSLINIVSPELSSYIDTSVMYYQPYTYKIQIKTETHLSLLSDPATITIGPYNIYIADFWDSSIRIVSWDGNYTISSYPLFSPRNIRYRRLDNRFCIADYYDKKLRLLTPDLNNIESLDLPDYPLDLDIDQYNSITYIATRNGLLFGINLNQEIIFEKNLGLNLNWNTQLSYDHKAEGCWISVPDSNTVMFINLGNNTSTIKVFDNFIFPTVIEAHGNAWVSDSTGLYTISKGGELDTIIFNTIVKDVALDTINNKCYFSGYNRDQQSWQIGNIDMNTFAKTIILDGEKAHLYNIFPLPGKSADGFLVQQAYTWKLFRYDNHNNIIGESNGFNSRLSFQIY
mgnify:CR=1 FL=1